MDDQQAPQRGSSAKVGVNHRVNLWYGALILIGLIIVLRLFWLQIVRHDYYRKAALNDQLRQYSISADRGIIEAHDANGVVPIVLNEQLYTVYADPTLVKNSADDAIKLSKVMGGNASDYQKLLKKTGTRYVVLAKRVGQDKEAALLAYKMPGIGAQAQDYRTYPEGDMAAQILGFVNDDGAGTYGIEQSYNKQLAGTPGMLKAITDVSGVPLVSSRGNVQIAPKAGSNVELTIDIGMQKQLETILKQGLDRVGAKSGSALIIDPNTGAIKAMANYPTFDPSKFYDVGDLSVFSNAAISSPLEVGSIMKTLTISTGLDQGVITPTTTYVDPGYVSVDGATIKNLEPIPETPTSIQDVLKFSLNTGAIHVLKELGGGDFSQKGRDILHEYLVNHFQLDKATDIELPNENPGYIADPDQGPALDLKYANTAFGQGMTATILQMAAAVSSGVNGGTYYKPHIVESVIDQAGKSAQTKITVVKQNVISTKTSGELRGLMQYVFEQNHGLYKANVHPGYIIGGKTGTAQIANPAGGYYDNKFNGTFVGFVGGDKPQYVVAVLVNTPNIPGYDSAGAEAAAPIFGATADMLIDNYNVVPVSSSN